MKLAPTFKLVGNAWHLTRFSDLKEGDIIKTFNTSDAHHEGSPVDFQGLERLVCTSDAYLSNSGPDGDEAVWTIQCESEDEDDNSS